MVNLQAHVPKSPAKVRHVSLTCTFQKHQGRVELGERTMHSNWRRRKGSWADRQTLAASSKGNMESQDAGKEVR